MGSHEVNPQQMQKINALRNLSRRISTGSNNDVASMSQQSENIPHPKLQSKLTGESEGKKKTIIIFIFVCENLFLSFL